MNAIIDTCPNCHRPLEDGQIFCDDCAFLPIDDKVAIATLERIAAEQARALDNACLPDDLSVVIEAGGCAG